MSQATMPDPGDGRQWCTGCERWKFLAIHSCPGVPQSTRGVAMTVSLHRAVSTVLDIYDTNGEESVKMADALRAVMVLHRPQSGALRLCVGCLAKWPCPTVDEVCEALGVDAGGSDG